MSAQRRREWRKQWPGDSRRFGQLRRYRRMAWLHTWADYTTGPRPVWMEAHA